MPRVGCASHRQSLVHHGLLLGYSRPVQAQHVCQDWSEQSKNKLVQHLRGFDQPCISLSACWLQ